jgi:hypothetical protein
MKAKFVHDNLKEAYDDYSSYDEPVELKIEEKPNPEDVEFSEEDMIVPSGDLEVALKNELKVPEYARRIVSFRSKGEPGIIDAIPMARMKDGSFLMKIGNKFRKFKMSDIIEESAKVINKS